MNNQISTDKVPQQSFAPERKNDKIVTIGLIQMSSSKSIAKNSKKAIEKIKEAVEQGAQIVCLHELFLTRYFPQRKNISIENLAESIPGESTKLFCELAKKNKIVIILPMFERDKSGIFYNSAVVIDSTGKIIDTYRKVHIPYDPYFYEKDYFAAGNLGYKIFNTRVARIGVLICYDQWFPEPARISALKGAEIIFYPTTIGYVKGYTSEDGDWHDAWKTVQRAHAIENGVHIAAVNRVGAEGKLEFWGGSFVCDSFGKIIKEASTTKEEVVVAQVDLSKNKKIQEGWGFLKNRRPDSYNVLVKGDKRGLTDE